MQPALRQRTPRFVGHFAGLRRRFPSGAGLFASLLACSCGAGEPRFAAAPGAERASIEAIDDELHALSRGLTAAHRDTFRGILEDTLAKDPYVCRPSPRQVFFGEAPEGSRTIEGALPHYGFFFGPMRYRVRRRGPGEARGWEVSVTIALDFPRASRIELPDCALVREVSGDESACRGVPYSSAPSVEACPGSGSFSLPATTANLRALLGWWSREAERYYNRDAEHFAIPVHYDFTFVEAPVPAASPVDLATLLSPTCGRTPYFSAFRSGWSLPIVAHEVGHVLGLLDEYEAFSGLSSAYPKTPFPGAEQSRMGLSMREGTRVLPLHHYLILRRYLCAEPARGSFYEAAPPM